MATFDYTPLNPPLDATNYPDLFTTFFGDISTDLTGVSDATDLNTAYRIGIPATGFSLNDGVALLLGDVDDTSISHTGTATDINHTGTGDLRLINTSNIVAIGDTYVNLLDNITLNFGTTLQGTIRYDLANTELDITSTNIHLTGIVEITGATSLSSSWSINGTAVSATAAELNDLAGNAVDAADFTKLSQVTTTSTELNDLAGNAVDAADFTKLSQVTATSTELNLLAGRVLSSTDNVIDNFPAGTLALFQQTSAPVGWTKQTTHNNKAFRVVSGTAASGGSVAFSTVFARTATDAHTLSESQIPSHRHTAARIINVQTAGGALVNAPGGAVDSSIVTDYTGGGLSHTHNMDIRVQYVDIIIASKN